VTELPYAGAELDVFAQATTWKRYWSSLVRPWLGSRILDVGAGIGSTVDVLGDTPHTTWLALEPDPNLAARLRARKDTGSLRSSLEIRVGTLMDLGEHELFDAILYIDVLEHIENDREELANAAGHLAEGGHLIVLAPAHQWLFTEFDAAIGHFRRYTRAGLRRIAPAELACIRLDYLDSIGLLASMGNRFLLRSSQPSLPQIRLWDGIMVPTSRFVDPMLGRRIGKSVLGIWRNGTNRA
jgi:SAM-dependent methyltransferase